MSNSLRLACTDIVPLPLVISLILRIAQFVFATIVLGLTAYFLYQRTRHGVGPFARIVFTVIWASLSIIFAIIWAIPTSSSMTGYVSDLGKLMLK